MFLAWGIGAFAIVAALALRNRIVVLNAAAMSALTMALTDLLPIDPFIHPVVPVLSGTYWLAVHVPIIMVGYSVLALGVVWLLGHLDRFLPDAVKASHVVYRAAATASASAPAAVPAAPSAP